MDASIVIHICNIEYVIHLLAKLFFSKFHSHFLIIISYFFPKSYEMFSHHLGHMVRQPRFKEHEQIEVDIVNKI